MSTTPLKRGVNGSGKGLVDDSGKRRLNESRRRRAPLARDIHSIVFATLLLLSFAVPVPAQSLTSAQLSAISFEQKLGAQIPLSLAFRDETGRSIKLGDYFNHKPIVLVLGYYECPMLCTLTFNGMVESMEELKWSIGNQFDVLHVSINPTETPSLAAAKKQTYLKRYGRPAAAYGWHFLTGEEAAIRTLADQVGFRYAYDPSIKQYAHPSGLIVLTPEGKVAKYLFGVKFSTTDLSAALKTASANKTGSRIEELVLLCFHYNPIKGKYGAAIMAIIRIMGAATLLGLVWLLGSGMTRRNHPIGHAVPPDADQTKERPWQKQTASSAQPSPPEEEIAL